MAEIQKKIYGKVKHDVVLCAVEKGNHKVAANFGVNENI
jgi:hypothetical protein